MKYSFFSFCCLCVAMIACKKDDDPTKSEIITQKPWYYEEAGLDQDKNGTIDIPPPAGFLMPCVTDNFITLAADGTGVVDEGPTRCAPQTPQTAPISWQLTNNETTLVLGGGSIIGISGQFRLNALTDTRLSLSKDTTISGFPLAIVINLKH